MAAALAYLLVAGSMGLALRRFARVAPATIVVLMLLPLLLSGRALLTGGVYGAIDLAYTSEPLAWLAERSGLTEIANPNASDVFAQFIPWHAAIRDPLRHHPCPVGGPSGPCGAAPAGVGGLARTPSRRNTGILTAMLCVTVLAGHPETTLHIVAVATGYFFYERRRMRDGEWSRAIRSGLLAGLLALLLTAFALLPFIEAARQTAEYRDRQTFVAVSWKPIPSLHALRDALLPF